MSRKIAVALKATSTGIQNYSNRGTLTDNYGIDPSNNIDYYILTTDGAVTLTNNIAISISPSSGTKAVTGDSIHIKYSCNVTLGVYTFTIFGRTVPSHLANKDFLIDAYFDGTNWNVVFIPSVVFNQETINNDNLVSGSITSSELASSAVTATELASDAVTTAKILNANVTVEKLEAEAKESVITIPVHFDYSAKDTFYVAIPTKCTFVRMVSVVSGVAIDGSNAATMSVTNGGGSVFSGVTLHAAGTGENSVSTHTPSSNAAIAQGNVLAFTPDGSATSGKVFISITVRREAD